MPSILLHLLRTIAVYLFLLVLLRLLGRREIGSFSAFDFLIALMIGDVLGSTIFGDVELYEGLGVVALIGAMHFANSWLVSHSKTVARFVEGRAVRVITKGEIDEKALLAERVSPDELMALLRLEGIERKDLADVEAAYLETDGKLSVLRTQEAQSAQKRDLSRAR